MTEYIKAEHEYDNINKQFNESTLKLESIKKNIKAFEDKNSNSNAALITKNTAEAKQALIDCTGQYKILRENAPDRASDLTASENALKELKMKEYQDNLDKIHP